MAELRKNTAGEIGAAVFRVAQGLRQGRLRDEFENYAVELVIYESREAGNILGKLLRLAELSGYVGREMAAILLRELGQFSYRNSASMKSEGKDVEKTARDILRGDGEIEEVERDRLREEGEEEEEEKSKKEEGKKGERGEGRGKDMTGKKLLDETLRFVRENPVSKFRDVQLHFGRVSERTLRRSLEHLVQMGRIERVGNPGPSSFYRPKKAISAPVAPESEVAPTENGEVVAENNGTIPESGEAERTVESGVAEEGRGQVENGVILLGGSSSEGGM